MSALQIIILAAGQGKRMNSALPKVLHDLAGKPMLAHVIATAKALAPRRIVVVYGHGGEAVRAAFAEDASLAWAHQVEQLGTGHAVKQALPLLGDDGVTLILYGDVPLIHAVTLHKLTQEAAAGQFGLLTIELAHPGAYGRIVRDADGRVTGIVEFKDATPKQRTIHEINTGLLAVPTALLKRCVNQLTNNNAQREYYLTDIIGMAAHEGVVIATHTPQSEWEVQGVNSKLELAQLERAHQREIAERLLAQGVTLRDPARIDVRGELTCGRDVEIDVNCVFEGKVHLADGVRVGANCVLRNISVGARTQILPLCHLEEATVGSGAHVGPFARFRPGAAIGDEVHIGNFVEVKNSTLGHGSKANHLAYVGDSDVGSGVNIGAGTITCNYDGAGKYRTVMEDGVFTGSNSTIVAPITLGKNSYVAAGSTITEDTPPDSLAIGRGRQVNKLDWKRPVKKKA